MLKIVIAPDSFKGSMSSFTAAQAIEEGVLAALGKAETVLMPVADGGEGTMDSLVAATGGRLIPVQVTDPLLRPVDAAYGVLGDGKTCVIEMASSSGICLLDDNELDPMRTTTYGTGELIKKALDDGFRSFILAIGGSATNDGGAGMLQALGMRLLDSSGESIGYGGGELREAVEIDDTHFDVRVAASDFVIASDVQNPLVGLNGASFVYGPQKGASVEEVGILDRNLSHLADLIELKTGLRLHEQPGAGAAGGIGAAFQAFFPSRTERGIEVVMKYAGLARKMAGADCVITGEGQTDFQTASGKTPMGVAKLAKEFGLPVFVLAGSVGSGIGELYKYGVTSIQSIINRPMSLQEAMEKGPELLKDAAEQVMRTYFSGR
ncbi:MAG: glycerate kinase [Bacillus sp. (in: firmicutes)]